MNFFWQVRRFSGYVFFGVIIALLFVLAIKNNGIGISEIIFSLILVALFAYNFTYKKKGE
ncbi:hypothetical protein [Photobacterium leiognathi]|uniref:hypothetical protein n=1 Tax=Photobacterium leiognathi TaxID=553611 RepID=UPI0027398D1E|nr:hypothetical protein [Photobacterium leiognathi]